MKNILAIIESYEEFFQYIPCRTRKHYNEYRTILKKIWIQIGGYEEFFKSLLKLSIDNNLTPEKFANEIYDKYFKLMRSCTLNRRDIEILRKYYKFDKIRLKEILEIIRKLPLLTNEIFKSFWKLCNSNKGPITNWSKPIDPPDCHEGSSDTYALQMLKAFEKYRIMLSKFKIFFEYTDDYDTHCRSMLIDNKKGKPKKKIYIIEGEPTTFQGAIKTCKDRKMQILCMDSLDEHNIILDLINDQNHGKIKLKHSDDDHDHDDFRYENSFWFGLNDLFDLNQYNCIATGKKLTFTPKWHFKEPDRRIEHNMKEKCGCISKRNKMWAISDEMCTDKRYAICERIYDTEEIEDGILTDKESINEWNFKHVPVVAV